LQDIKEKRDFLGLELGRGVIFVCGGGKRVKHRGGTENAEPIWLQFRYAEDIKTSVALRAFSVSPR